MTHQKTLIFLDTETSGLSNQNDSIIEIACVRIVDLDIFNIQSKQIFHYYIDTHNEIDARSMRIHGISSAQLKGKPFFGEIAQSLLDFIGTDSIVAHNAPFDMGFLNSELERVGLNKIENEVIDSLVIAKKLYPGSPVGIDALIKRFGMGNTRGLHSAKEDALLLAKIYAGMHAPSQESLLVNQAEEVETKFSLCSKRI